MYTFPERRRQNLGNLVITSRNAGDNTSKGKRGKRWFLITEQYFCQYATLPSSSAPSCSTTEKGQEEVQLWVLNSDSCCWRMTLVPHQQFDLKWTTFSHRNENIKMSVQDFLSGQLTLSTSVPSLWLKLRSKWSDFRTHQTTNVFVLVKTLQVRPMEKSNVCNVQWQDPVSHRSQQ